MEAVRLAAEVAEDEARLRALVPAAAGRPSVYTYDAASATQSELAAALHAEQAEAAADAAPSRDEVHASIVTKLTARGCSVAAALSFVGRSRDFWYHRSKRGGGGSRAPQVAERRSLSGLLPFAQAQTAVCCARECGRHLTEREYDSNRKLYADAHSDRERDALLRQFRFALGASAPLLCERRMKILFGVSPAHLRRIDSEVSASGSGVAPPREHGLCQYFRTHRASGRTPETEEAAAQQHFDAWTFVPPDPNKAGKYYRKTWDFEKNSISDLCKDFNAVSGLSMSAKVYERIAKGVMREEGSCGLFGVSSDHNFCTLCKGFMVRVANCRTQLAGAAVRDSMAGKARY